MSTKAIELLEKAKRMASGCTCDPAYKSRNMADPGCAACDFHEVMECVDAALSDLQAQGEGDREKLTEAQIEDIADEQEKLAFKLGLNDALNPSYLVGMKAGLRYYRDHVRPASAPDITGLDHDAVRAVGDAVEALGKLRCPDCGDGESEQCQWCVERSGALHVIVTHMGSGSLSKSYTKQEVEAIVKALVDWTSGYYFDREELMELARKHGLNTDTHA